MSVLRSFKELGTAYLYRVKYRIQGNMSVLRSFTELDTAYLYRVKYRVQGNMSVLRSFTELDTAYLYRVKYRIQGNMSLLCTFTELGTMCLYRVKYWGPLQSQVYLCRAGSGTPVGGSCPGSPEPGWWRPGSEPDAQWSRSSAPPGRSADRSSMTTTLSDDSLLGWGEDNVQKNEALTAHVHKCLFSEGLFATV